MRVYISNVVGLNVRKINYFSDDDDDFEDGDGATVSSSDEDDTATSTTPPGMHCLADSAFQTTEEVINLIRRPAAGSVLARVPPGRKENVFCLMDDSANVTGRRNGGKSSYVDF